MSGLRGARLTTILIAASSELVIIDDKVAEIASRFVVHPEDAKEAGGILIGCYRGPHLEITECTTPMAGDVRSRFMFYRRDKGHHRRANEAWRQSGHALTFVGEWHTHPEDHPTPSFVDKATWHSVMRKHDDPMLFLIVGRKSVWCGIGRDRSLARLNVAEGPLHMPFGVPSPIAAIEFPPTASRI